MKIDSDSTTSNSLLPYVTPPAPHTMCIVWGVKADDKNEKWDNNMKKIWQSILKARCRSLGQCSLENDRWMYKGHRMSLADGERRNGTFASCTGRGRRCSQPKAARMEAKLEAQNAFDWRQKKRVSQSKWKKKNSHATMYLVHVPTPSIIILPTSWWIGLLKDSQ